MNSLGNIPDGLSNLKHSVLNNVDKAVTNVTNYVEGRSAENKAGRMRLYPPPPFAGVAGQELSQAKKIANGVFGFVGAPVIAVVYAPLANYKNVLLDKREQLLGKLDNPTLKMISQSEVAKKRAENATEDPAFDKLLKNLDSKFLNKQLVSVNKKLEKVDKKLSGMTTTTATLKHNLKGLTATYYREREVLRDLKFEKQNYEANLKNSPNLDDAIRKDTQDKVTELTEEIKSKEAEVTQLKRAIAKLDKGLPDTFEDEIVLERNEGEEIVPERLPEKEAAPERKAVKPLPRTPKMPASENRVDHANGNKRLDDIIDMLEEIDSEDVDAKIDKLLDDTKKIEGLGNIEEIESNIDKLLEDLDNDRK